MPCFFGNVKTLIAKQFISELHAEIQSLFNAFAKKSHKVTGLLKDFEDELGKQKKTDSTESRMHILQCASLKKEFQDIVQENQEIITKYHNYMKEMYKKTLKISRIV